MRLLIVAIFGVLGVLLRYGVDSWVVRHFSAFPLGTLVINVTGAFLAGVFFVLGSERHLIPPNLQIGLIVGFLGGFTTFSAYALQSARMLSGGPFKSGLLYFAVSPLLGLVSAYFGMWVAR